ncbi:hypothetical protein [Nocardia nova]|uniref:hypothetical protein n=1 Tax=Nocardia nova TaxID=37330 RepID=UPI0015E6DD1F|nr:hypothetical protein [Nocardia nova]
MYVEPDIGQRPAAGTLLRQLRIEYQGAEDVCPWYRLGTAGEIAEKFCEREAVVEISSPVAFAQHHRDRDPATGVQFDLNESAGIERYVENRLPIARRPALDAATAVASCAPDFRREPTHRLDLLACPPPIFHRPRLGFARNRVVSVGPERIGAGGVGPHYRVLPGRHLMLGRPIGLELVYGAFSERLHICHRKFGDGGDVVVGQACLDQRDNFDLEVGQTAWIRYRRNIVRTYAALGLVGEIVEEDAVVLEEGEALSPSGGGFVVHGVIELCHGGAVFGEDGVGDVE